jgi:hypothetical protein
MEIFRIKRVNHDVRLRSVPKQAVEAIMRLASKRKGEM